MEKGLADEIMQARNNLGLHLNKHNISIDQRGLGILTSGNRISFVFRTYSESCVGPGTHLTLSVEVLRN